MSETFFQSIEDADTFLEQWITATAGVGEVSFSHPLHSPDKSINAFLYSLSPAPSRDINSESPVRFTLNYLVSVKNKNTREAHAVLSTLVFSALEHPDLITVFPPAELLAMLNPEILPGLGISLAAARFRKLQQPKLVRKPLIIEPAMYQKTKGLIVSKHGKALNNVKVSLPSIHHHAVTNETGEFTFSFFPANIGAEDLASHLVITMNDKVIGIKSIENETIDTTFVLKITLED